MNRRVAAVLAVVVLASCGRADVIPMPQPTPNINQSRLDTVYTAIASLDVHRVSSRALLMAALTAVRAQATSTGGTVDPVTPVFSDVSDAVDADFRLFAHTVEAIARRNPQLSAELISQAAIDAMVRATPDCLTQYQYPIPDFTSGLRSRLLPEGIGYVAWHNFVGSGERLRNAFSEDLRKALDGLVAQGARAWLFDLRDHPGFGQGTDIIASWFLNGEPLYQRVGRDGTPQAASARTSVRLPGAYQLPIAIVLNHHSGGGAEVVAIALRENDRATIVGSRSIGCVGTVEQVALSGGGQLIVATQEFVGPITGRRYNNVGIVPDVAADDAVAIDVASKLLATKVTR